MSHYNLIPESVYTVTSVSTKKTTNFDTGISNFSYRKVKPEYFFGYKIIKHKNNTFKIADIEKSLIDYFYLNPHYNSSNDFFELRINKEVFNKEVNFKKLNGYLIRIGKKTLSKRMKSLIRFLEK